MHKNYSHILFTRYDILSLSVHSLILDILQHWLTIMVTILLTSVLLKYACILFNCVIFTLHSICIINIHMHMTYRRVPGRTSLTQRDVLQGTHRFARLTCVSVWTPTSTHRQFIICLIYSSKFYSKPNFVFKDYILKFYLQC